MSSKAFTASTFRFLHQVNADTTLPASDMKVAMAFTVYFRLVFDLTRAEARLAQCMARGDTLEEIATSLEIGAQLQRSAPSCIHPERPWPITSKGGARAAGRDDRGYDRRSGLGTDRSSSPFARFLKSAAVVAVTAIFSRLPSFATKEKIGSPFGANASANESY